MIKYWINLIAVIAVMSTGCNAQKNMLTDNINAVANKEPVEDSVLQRLQSENDLVIAYAVESFAWVKSINYRVLTKSNGEWKGYVYHKNLMRNNAGSPTTFTTAAVDKAACDALLNYLTENEAWKIKGDSGNGFCSDGNKNCNINDANSARLWLMTKTGVLNPSYYAPDFFENCCPDKQRGLFVSITKKITDIVADEGATK
jgi:hypothetical protein